MPFRIIGHPDLDQQVPKVLAADPRRAPLAVARIRGLLESYDEDPADLEPPPTAQQRWNEGLTLRQRNGGSIPRVVPAEVAIYVYEAWALRFAMARVELPGDTVVGAWLMVESQIAVAAGIATQHLSMSLLSKVEELEWPI